MKITLSKIVLLIALSIGLIACGPNEKKSTNNTSVPKIDSNSIEFINQSIRENPMDADLYAQRATIQMDRGDVPAAIKDIQLALDIDSTSANYLIELAGYELTLGRSGLSKEALEKCLSYHPEHVDALFKLAEIHLYVQQYKESMEYIVKGLELEPNNAHGYYLKALIYKENEQIDQAIYNLQQTVQKDPRFYNGYMLLGTIYYDKQDSLALDYFRLALRLNEKSIEAHYNIGMFYQQSGQFEKAIRKYEELLVLADPGYFDALYNIGFIHLEYNKDYNKAVDYFSRVIDLKSNYFQAYHNRGVAFEMLKDYSRARADYEMALSILPNYNLSVMGLNRLDQKAK